MEKSSMLSLTQGDLAELEKGSVSSRVNLLYSSPSVDTMRKIVDSKTFEVVEVPVAFEETIKTC